MALNRTPDRGREDGFTLVELMVALAIFSIAVLALFKLQGESRRAGDWTRQAALAAIVAENQLIETVAAPQTPRLGVEEGEVEMAGQRWTWRREIAAAPGTDLLRIDISAGLTGSGHVAAALTGFRGRS